MKTLTLDNYGVQEISKEQMIDVDGGFILAATAITLAALYLAGTCAALSNGYNPHTGQKM